MAKAKKDNEIRLVRAFSAPVKLVWEAFTDVAHQENWWGPRGFTITSTSKDLSVGGKWIYTMHGPDGVDFPNYNTYLEVEKYSRLVYDHGANVELDPLFRVTVTFEEFSGSTVMDMTMSFSTPEGAKETEKMIKKFGGTSTWDRLGEYIEQEKNKKDVFIINRSFKASINEIFEMWINPEHFAKWMGPSGSSMSFLSVDVKNGGHSHYEMTDAAGSTMYGIINYKDVSSPNSLIYTQSFCDENKNIIKPSFAPTWPDAMLTTITFVDEGEGETRVTLKWEVYEDATEEERKTFNTAKDGMTGGWTGTFDKLEEYLIN